ncbi:MAG TPA: hypothetical protein EYG38_01995 [Verrucomicrobia bacterium]|nr:hypothetical protein [Verrucomicrobiota bacterium]
MLDRKNNRQLSFMRIKAIFLMIAVFCVGNGNSLPAAEFDPSSFPELEPESKPSVRAVRIDVPLKIDGKLDEPVWLEAPPAGPFYQSESVNLGHMMTELTLFRVLYDDENLYIGVWCYDSQPEGIIARTMERDSTSIMSDDYLYMAIDTFHDQRNGYIFITNSNGARRDEIVTNNIFRNSNWNGVWLSRGSIDSEGWKSEIAIPLKTLSFDPSTEVWGFNISRTIARKNERGRWTGGTPSIKTYHVAQAGDVTGLRELKQGIGLEVSPYFVGRFRDSDSGTSRLGDFGGDVRYRITPNLSSTLSYNTDFAETEVDSRQLNFTRFPLFFPEKRAFFLEDSGVYEFGGLPSSPSRRTQGLRTPMVPYFTRRIGLSKDGDIVPIYLASKVAGRIGPTSLGFTDVVLDDDRFGTKNVIAGRVARDIWDQSTVGLLSTFGDPDSDDSNLLIGPDLRYRTSRFLGDKILEANAYALGTHTGGDDSEFDTAYGTNINYPNDLINASAQMIQIGKDFNPALGFVRRKDIRAYHNSFSINPRPDSVSWIRQYHITSSTEHFTDLSNRLETAEYSFTPMWIETEKGADIWVSTKYTFDGPDEDFELLGETTIPEGNYWWATGRVGLKLARQQKLSGGPIFEFGEFYDGHLQKYQLEVNYLPSKYFSVEADYSFNDFQLPNDEFDTHLGSTRIVFNFTPELVWSNLVQYDSLSETVGYNSRIQWEYLPGSRLFLVLNQNYFSEDLSLELTETEVALKVGAVFRF